MAKQITLRGLIIKHIPRMFMNGQLFTDAHITDPSTQKPSKQRWSNRSLWIRHLDCGSCNGCELELTALENPVYDAQHLGIQFKASPRHADVVAMTGPFTRNLAEAAKLTVEAMPVQRIVLIGDCAINKGIYQGSYALTERPAEVEDAIIARVPGCPPTPQDMLDALCQLQLTHSKNPSQAKQSINHPSNKS